MNTFTSPRPEDNTTRIRHILQVIVSPLGPNKLPNHKCNEPKLNIFESCRDLR